MNPIAAIGIIRKKLKPSEEINKRTELTNSNNGIIFNKNAYPF